MKTKKKSEKKAVKKIRTNRKTSSRSSDSGKVDLIAIFKAIKALVKKYEGPLAARVDNDSQYHLWSEKEVVIASRPRKEVYFAGLVMQSNYVGFYYMPIYTNEGQKKVFKPELLKTLKGKSCFHIKSDDAILLGQIEQALKAGFDMYRKNGWV
jgi:hypothetical protein